MCEYGGVHSSVVSRTLSCLFRLLGFLGSCASAQRQRFYVQSCLKVVFCVFSWRLVSISLRSICSSARCSLPQFLNQGATEFFHVCSSATIPEGSTFTTSQCFRVRIESRQLRINVKSRSHYLSLLLRREQHPSVSEKQHLDSRFIKYCFIC